MKRFVLLAFVILAACVPPQARQAGRELAIVGARIYPAPGEVLVDATVIVRDGRIADVGPAADVRAGASARVIDGRGLVVVAGLWNSHVHLMSPTLSQPPETNAAALSAELEAMLTRWGFTSVFDVSSLPGHAIALRERIAADEVRGPNILTVDAPFFPDKGTPIYVREVLAGQPSFEIRMPGEGAARAKAQIASGANGVKIFAGAIVGPPQGVLPMPLDVAKAIVAEAHRAGKPAFAHPTNMDGLSIAIDSGVDILAHTAPDSGIEWSQEVVARLKAHDMALIPTLTLWEVELRKDKAPEAVVQKFVGVGQQQLKAYADAGGQILFGTDVGYTDAFDTSAEYRLMAEAGLDFSQVLASLTTAPAKRFGFPRKGAVKAGMDGDLTVLSADPAADMTALAKVAYTIRDGEIIYAAAR